MHRSVLCVGEDLGIGADVRTFLLPSSNMDRDLLEVWPHRPPQGVGGVVPVVASCEQAWTRSTGRVLSQISRISPPWLSKKEVDQVLGCTECHNGNVS